MSEDTAPSSAGHQHGPGHRHVHEEDWDAAGDRLESEAEVGLGFLEGAARWLAELAGPPVHRVLDLGSGPGVASCVFAATFPDAVVHAVDGSQPLLERASARAARLGLGERLVVARRELPDGMDALEPADLVWASRVVHHLGDQDEAVRGMAALVRPGGLLALAEGGLPTPEPSPGTSGSVGLDWRPDWTRPSTTGSPTCARSNPDRRRRWSTGRASSPVPG
ncbi:MAG TPA: class I SAM-dependent methyltransferase [Cryptosporangiaceae bacterium]|nr:class I SAM-dependent methyltransferase [Cryptosporangiaceae bacterium]